MINNLQAYSYYLLNLSSFSALGIADVAYYHPIESKLRSGWPACPLPKFDQAESSDLKLTIISRNRQALGLGLFTPSIFLGEPQAEKPGNSTTPILGTPSTTETPNERAWERLLGPTSSAA